MKKLKREVKRGTMWRHFKGGLYLVEDIACDSHSAEDVVIYRAMNSTNLLWVRPLTEFLSEVDHEKYPNCQQKYRFERFDVENLMKSVSEVSN